MSNIKLGSPAQQKSTGKVAPCQLLQKLNLASNKNGTLESRHRTKWTHPLNLQPRRQINFLMAKIMGRYLHQQETTIKCGLSSITTTLSEKCHWLKFTKTSLRKSLNYKTLGLSSYESVNLKFRIKI